MPKKGYKQTEEAKRNMKIAQNKLEVRRKIKKTWNKKIENGYISPLKNRPKSEKHKKNISLGRHKRKKRLGYLLSPETREKLRKNAKTNPNFGMKGKHHSEKTKQKLSLIKLERKEKLGYIHSPETREKMSKSQKIVMNKPEAKQRLRNIGFQKGNIPIHPIKKGQHISPKTEFKKGHEFGNRFQKGNIPWNKGLRGVQAGKNHYNWQGGKSFEPYGIEFNDILKEQIRERDVYTCQECSKLEGNKAFDVHHIDYNKKNNDSLNLITLCRKCHIKTNYKRKHWKRYFKMKIFIKELFNPENVLIFNENKQLIDVIRYYKNKFLK